MRDHLFVYGTLKAGLAPSEMSLIVEKLRPIANATVRGLLYDLGEYPGAILNPDSERNITGLVLELPDDPDVLVQLDQYEQFDPDSPHTSLFLRVRTSALLETGRTLECWVYVYNRDPASVPIPENGKFTQRKR
jgi:gamma-glutamylcyclotransferase (GGCT)/AIG2-like uncharacterized protein YtfP